MPFFLLFFLHSLVYYDCSLHLNSFQVRRVDCSKFSTGVRSFAETVAGSRSQTAEGNLQCWIFGIYLYWMGTESWCRRSDVLTVMNHLVDPERMRSREWLHFAWVIDNAKCIVVTCICLCVCLSVCVSVCGRMPTLLHGPGCSLGVW